MVFEKTLFFNSEPARRNNSSNKAEDFTVEIVPTIILDQNKNIRLGWCLLVLLIRGII